MSRYLDDISLRSSFGTPAIFSPNSTLSDTVNHGNNAPSSFTPSTNPVIGPELYEQMNFTVNDVHALIHPDSRLLQEGFWLTDEITSANGTETKPDYLYWVSEREMRDADVSLDNLDFAWHLAPTVNGSFLVFLRAHEDFDRVISSLP